MRLIDADDLGRHAFLAEIGDHRFFIIPLKAVNNAPTIDAVPVVRCGECVHAKPIPDAKANYFADGGKCCEILRGNETNGVSVVWDEGYCDDGHRKDGKHG